jgi:signal transduction histidine kinase/HAMP domain-containing protein
MLRLRAHPVRIGMRFWLPLAFALIAAVTALIVSWVFSGRSEHALRASAEDLALASTLGASDSVDHGIRRGNLNATVAEISANRGLAIFVYNEHAELISPGHSRGIQLRYIRPRGQAVATALTGGRFVSTIDNGHGTLVAIPIPRSGGVILTYSPRPELQSQVGIVHRQVVQAALFASLAGALAGLIVAMLIASRLRRIAQAADAIEGGSFDTRLHPWLKDELGGLAETIDRMRGRLRESFGRLESERDRLRRVLGRLHDGVISVDSDLKIDFSNAAARRLLRTPVDEGDDLPDAWGEPVLRELAARLFEPGARAVQETFQTGDRRAYSVAGIPPRGRSKNAILVVTDVSVRERRERAEREFVTNAAHELRTPLATITGAIQVLQAGAKDDAEERDRFLDHIEREAARLGRLTHSLLVLARAQTREESPNLAPVELQPLLEAIVQDAHPPPDVEVSVSCPPGLEVLAERDLVEQAVANLTANALQNTERGSVEIVARRLPSGSVALEVTDTGSGIAAERQERIFDRFYRPGGRDPRRFGLGLAIVRQAVAALGGRIELESAVGSGTTVRITLAGAQEREAVA